MNLTLIKGMRLVVATHNAGKAVEIDALLGGHYTVVTAARCCQPKGSKAGFASGTSFAGGSRHSILPEIQTAVRPGGFQG